MFLALVLLTIALLGSSFALMPIAGYAGRLWLTPAQRFEEENQVRYLELRAARLFRPQHEFVITTWAGKPLSTGYDTAYGARWRGRHWRAREPRPGAHLPRR